MESNGSIKSNHLTTLIPYFDSEKQCSDIEKTKNDSKPIVLLLHGLFGGLSNFDAVIDLLSSKYRFIMPLIPFFDEDALQTIEQLQQYVLQFLKVHFEGQKIHVIGNSLGGQLALFLAHSHPELFTSMVLTGSAGLMENEFGCSIPKRFNKSYLRDRVKEVFYEKELDESELSIIQSVITSPRRCQRLIHLAKNSKKSNCNPFIDQLLVPTLLIWGENDQITPPHIAEQFHEFIPDSRLKWISECGHAPMMEKPGAFAAYCDEFFGTLEIKLSQEKETSRICQN